MIDRERFRGAYRQAVSEVMRFVTPERQEVIARHNLGLHPDRSDLRLYLEASERRYLKVVDGFNAHRPDLSSEGLRTLDVGGFLGAFPLALARCGLEVTLAEEYDYYYGAFDDLAQFLEGQGVGVWGADFTQPLAAESQLLAGEPHGDYHLITNMAMIEHLPSSPRQLLENLRAHMDSTSVLFVEVPNVAYWPNRLKALRGQSIHPPLELMYSSTPPFLGHHREYTVEELREILGWAGLEVVGLETFNYTSLTGGRRGLGALFGLLDVLPTLLSRNCRELILAASVLATGSGGSGPPGFSRSPAAATRD